MAIFLGNNLGQESRYKELNCYSLLPAVSLSPPRDATKLSLCSGGDWVLPSPYLLASVNSDTVWWSLLGTPVIVAGHINLVATQAKKVNKNEIPIA